ncbi:hypothetical protein [Flavobacterium sp. TAB 87]|uniref:hypothetical protein n=1 Tax=Flavobacterium sp. TAB 87 TaxID=1729581 RepID=UPI00082C3289|nr:hypothetical protein [Flavobacterium sp. TAB 87]
MKKIVLLFLILQLSAVVAQVPTFSASYLSTQTIDKALFVGVDSFDYLYKIKDNTLFKSDKNQTFTYKNIYLGKIATVDLINPLRIAVFYEGFNSVALIDNQLNETTVINFSEKSNAIMATAVGMASQNQLWVYNSLTQQIGLYNYLNNEYKNISIPLKSNFIYYQTDFNNFYWIDTDKNWYSCDPFGKIILLAKAPLFDRIQLLNDSQFIYMKDNLLFFTEIIDQKNSVKMPILLSEKTFENFYYKDQILSIFTSAEKTNYKLILP